MKLLKQFFFKIVGYFYNKQNWKKPTFWIIVFIGLRLLTVACREYGFTLGKKKLKGEHVFLTGAGSGIGRLMAIKMGLQGCRLSLSDINLAGVKETQQILIKAGVPAENICAF